jgi:undecaprenyl-diphosphatase
MAIAALVLSLSFALVTWQVATSGPLRRADERLSRAAVGAGPRWLTESLADLGNAQLALPVLAASITYAAGRACHAGVPRWWLPSLAAALAMAAVPSLVTPLKAALDRPGPLTAETGCFPSGHTATAAVAYVGAALLLFPYTRGRLLPAAVLLSTAAGVGLVLRGYHWPLDVVGSWCLSGLLLLPLLSLTGSLTGRLPPHGLPPPHCPAVRGDRPRGA